MIGVQRYSKFTCGRCGVEEVKGVDAQPATWARLTVTRPPLANPTEVAAGDRTELLLCQECRMNLHNVWLEK